MIVHRIGILCCCLWLSFPGIAAAHGGVVEEDDLCVIKVNYLRAHFKIYQPRVSGHKQFCEDLPVAAESIFVMEYEHDLLKQMPIDFRVIRDVTGKGRFARLEDVQQISDLGAVTVFYRPAGIEPDVYTVLHEFEEEGDFIGIVSALHPETGKLYTAVFPFEVGFTGLGYWPLIIGLLAILQLQYLYMSGRLRRWLNRGAPAVAALVLVMISTPVKAEDIAVSWSSEEPLRINTMQRWVLHVRDSEGEPVEAATIEIDGGMPSHNHGLPTRPRVTRELGGGDYQLEGLRFHMSGYWELVITVTTKTGTSTVTLALQL